MKKPKNKKLVLYDKDLPRLKNRIAMCVRYDLVEIKRFFCIHRAVLQFSDAKYEKLESKIASVING